jgi:uncharacterized oxidoreductase
MNISDNTIFIAGATSGIGLGLALRFQAAGNQVIIGGRRRALLDQISAEYPGISTVLIDITDPDSISTAATDVLTRFPELNVLVTMAGIMEPEDVHTADFRPVAERTVTTNLLGPVPLIAAFTEPLARRPHAAIITVSSGLAFEPPGKSASAIRDGANLAPQNAVGRRTWEDFLTDRTSEHIGSPWPHRRADMPRH